jgi:hypothetical protein
VLVTVVVTVVAAVWAAASITGPTAKAAINVNATNPYGPMSEMIFRKGMRLPNKPYIIKPTTASVSSRMFSPFVLFGEATLDELVVMV